MPLNYAKLNFLLGLQNQNSTNQQMAFSKYQLYFSKQIKRNRANTVCQTVPRKTTQVKISLFMPVNMRFSIVLFTFPHKKWINIAER